MKKGVLLILAIGLLMIAAAAGAWYGLTPPDDSRYQADVVQALSTQPPSSRFEQATEIRAFSFPQDFGPHPDYQTEWWYYTGNLQSDAGRRFGYQLTIFRQAVDHKPPQGESKWRSRQIYFAHFAVTDIKNKQFYSYERFSRGALELAGAQADPYRVWIEDWQARQVNEQTQLLASQDKVAIDLMLSSQKPIVLQGNQGLSQKGKREGNASYYFSQTRLSTTGTVRVGDETIAVSGSSWLDKEWSTSALERGESGWDWFSIQLNDKRELMLFQIRSGTGEISPYSSGSYIDQEGDKTALASDDFSLTPTDTWTSPATGSEYPVAWTIEIPSLKLKLQLEAFIKNQEHRHSFRYWEGAINVSAGSVDGHGYAELTGY